MLIGSKLPPERTERTYFHTGRAAFSFLIEQVIRPKKVYLPTFTCWSLVSAMSRRFPQLNWGSTGSPGSHVHLPRPCSRRRGASIHSFLWA